MTDELTVGQVAARFGVTVRTLHHYDAIGLVRPSERGWNGYRLYTPADVQRLARVVLLRRLEMPLADIAEALDEPAVLAALGPSGPGRWQRAIMDALFERALMPLHPSCARRGSALARWCLYVRGNWLRMPPLMLARHLWTKARKI